MVIPESKYRNDNDVRGTYWEGTPEEQVIFDAWNAKQQIYARLDQLDTKSIRPARAITAGMATQADIDMLTAIEAEAAELRSRI